MHSDVVLFILIFTLGTSVQTSWGMMANTEASETDDPITFKECMFVGNWSHPFIKEKVEIRSCSENVASFVANNKQLEIDGGAVPLTQIGDAANGHVYYTQTWGTIDGDFDLREFSIKMDVSESEPDFCVSSVDIYSRGMHVKAVLPSQGIHWTHPDCDEFTDTWYKVCQKQGNTYEFQCDERIDDLRSQQLNFYSCARF